MFTKQKKRVGTDLTPTQIQDSCCVTCIFSARLLLEHWSAETLRLSSTITVVLLVRPSLLGTGQNRPHAYDLVLTASGKILSIFAKFCGPDRILCGS